MNVNKIREDFPILRSLIYNKPLVYLDSAATTQKPNVVLESIKYVYENTNSNIHRGVHHLSNVATLAHEEARGKVAKFIGAKSCKEILFTRGTTEAVNLVANCFTECYCKEGDEIILTTMEHHSNIVPWQMMAERHKLQLRIAPIDEKGDLILDEMFALINERTKLIAVAHVSNVLGTVNPVKDIIAKAHKHGVMVLVDGAQAIAHTPVDVCDLDADFYVFSGHKVYAPNGIGVLYGKENILNVLPPYQGGGEMIGTVTFEKTTYNELPYKYEAGTPDYVGSVALGVALDYLSNIGMDKIAEHENELMEYATAELLKIPEVRIIGNANKKSGALSFVVGKIHPMDIGALLDKQGVAIRTGHHCAQPLIDHLGINGTARISFGIYTTKEDIDAFIKALNVTLGILM